jgi:CRP-like cAMP-binding protein
MIGFKFLKSHALFGGLTEDEINSIRPLLKEESFSKGDTIVYEGRQAGKLFFICSGSVEILKKTDSPKGSVQRRIATLGVGDTFGEMELIDVQPCIATVHAIENTAVLTLSNMDLYKISKSNLKTYTLIIMNLAREISRRLRRADGLLADALFSEGDREKSKG